MPDDHRDYTPYGMFAWHENRCAICGASPRVVIDHDHGTGLVRGLLCVSCNTAEAHHDDPAFVRYRRMPPAFLFQVVIPWSNSHNWQHRVWRGAW